MVMSIKNARFKLQPSTSYAILCQKEVHTLILVSTDLIGITPFMEIDDKGGEICTKI